jgi:hypothetical protein
MACLTPVVFLIFRRADLTAQVFEAIRQAQPTKLLIVADGPRDEAEAQLCAETRAIVEQVDWDCEVLRNYSEVNLGCRKRVATGLDWAFEQVAEAIILEDDCLPHPSFFNYCHQLLEYYREDQRVWSISGNNFQNDQQRGDGSYYFSNYYHVWGWAGWRRSWQQYDYHFSKWPDFRDGQYLTGILDSELEVEYWQGIFNRMHAFGEPNTWDYAVMFSLWLNKGLSVLPNVNLISNIGHRSDATHTTGDSQYAHMAVGEIDEIKHPTFIARDRAADMYTFDHVYGGLEIQLRKQESKLWHNRLRKQAGILKRQILKESALSS